MGIGCRRDVLKEEVLDALTGTLAEADIDLGEIRTAATVDLKKQEAGLLEACRELHLPLVFVDRLSIERFCGPVETSETVLKAIGLKGVCEPCALIAGKRADLVVRKTKFPKVTIAVARERILEDGSARKVHEEER